MFPIVVHRGPSSVLNEPVATPDSKQMSRYDPPVNRLRVHAKRVRKQMWELDDRNSNHLYNPSVSLPTYRRLTWTFGPLFEEWLENQ